MKQILFTLAFTLIASFAHAQATTLPIDRPDLGMPSTTVAKLQASVRQMEISPDGNYCTVFQVSKTGYLLTALHCVHDCLIEQGLTEEASSPFIGLQGLSVSTHSKNTGAVCANLKIAALGVSGIKVVATGSALSNFDSSFVKNYPALVAELQAHGFASRANDYAVLKIEPLKPLDCLALKTSGAITGLNLYAVGYPLPLIQFQTPELSGSPGRPYSSAQESIYYRSQTKSEDRTWVELQYSDPKIVYANANSQYGQSGGPIVLQDGTVIGITSGFTNTIAANNSETHELVGGSTQSILADLAPALAQQLVQANAACH